MSKVTLLRPTPSSTDDQFQCFILYVQSLKVGECKTIKQILMDNPKVDSQKIETFLENVNSMIAPLILHKLNKTTYELRVKSTRSKKAKVNKKESETEVLLEMTGLAVMSAFNACESMMSQLRVIRNQLHEIKSKMKGLK